MMESHHFQAQTKTWVCSSRKVALPLYQEFSGTNLRGKSIRKTPFLIESAVKIQNLRRLHFSIVSLPSGLSVSVNQIPMNNATAPRYFQGRIFTSWQVKEAWSPKWEYIFFFKERWRGKRFYSPWWTLTSKTTVRAQHACARAYALPRLFIMGCDTWRPIRSQSAILFYEFLSL